MKQRTKKRISTFLALLLSLAMVMPAMNGVTLTAKAAEYVGDWGEGFSVAASEFADITGESMVCIDYTVVEESEAYQFKLNNKLDEWVPLEEDAFTYLEYEINEWGFTDVPDTDSRAVVVLSADAVAALAEGDGLCVQVFGLIIDNVTVIDGLNLGRTWELDSSYPEPEEWGGFVSAMIPVEALLQFDGAVAVTLDYVATGESEWPWFGVQSAQWNPLTPRGNTTTSNGEGTIKFVLSKEDIATAIEDGGIMFNLGDVYFTEVRLDDAKADDYYAGDYNEGFLLPKSAFEGFTDGASLSIDYRIVTDEAYTNNNGFLLINTSDWYAFEEEDYTYLEYPINEYLFINVPATDSNVKVSLSADVVEKIVAGDALRVEVFGLIIEDVTVNAPIVDNSIVMLDEAFPEADEDGDVMSAVIPAEKFVGFDGPVAIKLSYQTTGESAWAWYEVLTVEKNALTPEGCVYAEQETGTVTIVLDEEDIEKAVAEGGVAFRLHDVFFTKAKLSVPTPDDYYAGDWKDGYAVPASEFEGMENGATLLIDYRTVSGYESYQYKLNNNLDSWVPFTEEDYTYMEYGINEYGFTDVPDNDSRAVVVLNADAVAALTEGNGLTVQVFGVIIENVTVIDGLVTDRVFALDDSYPEADEWGTVVSTSIPAEALLQFNGPVAVTLDYVATGENEWPGFAPKTVEWRDFTPEGNVYINGSEGTITFVLDEEDIAIAIADGGIMFCLDEVYFTEARLSEAQPDDYYVGAWNSAYTFKASEIQGLSGDVVLTMKYYTTVSYDYEWFYILLTDYGIWKDLPADSYIGTEVVDESTGKIWINRQLNEMTIIIKEEAFQQIIANGGDLGIRGNGVIVEEATLEEWEEPDYADATGRTGNVVLDTSDPNCMWVTIKDGAPADGNVYLMTYEIYDEEGTLAGTLEFRTGSSTGKNSAWVTIGEKTQTLFAVGELLSPKMEGFLWYFLFGKEAVDTQCQYTYKVIEQKLLTEKMPTTTPSWDTTRSPGWAVWEPVEGATGYSFSFKHNGNPWVWGCSGETEENFGNYIDTNGAYTIEVTVIGDREHCDSEVTVSSIYEYTRPEKVIPMPEKIWWTAVEGSEIPSIINWTPVEGAMGYEVTIEAYDAQYPNGSSLMGIIIIDYNTADGGLCTYYDFTETIRWMNEQGAEEGISYIYRVEVRAISGNIEIYANSDRLESKPSGEYKTLEAIEQELKESIQEEGLDAVIEASGIKEVADAMKNNAEVLEEVVEEEQKHREKNGVLGALLNFVEEIVTESIRIVGAALNVESGSYNISFNEAESKMKIDRDLYHNPMQVDISLDTEGGKVSELKVPVVITMEAPKNIAKDRLVILHEHNGIVESIFPSFNDDGTISFATTGFSTFAFAGINLYDDNGMEEVSNEGDFGDEPEPTPSPSPTPTPDPVEAFVERMYILIMGRDADSGLDFWVGELKSGAKTGAEVAAGFVLSEEFLNKEMTDAEFVQIMYKTFFNREADESGLAWWTGEMSKGKSKKTVFAGFVNSGEFGEVCATYGITQGSVSLPEEETPTVSAFVKRLYSEIMGRDADEGGLSYWVSELEGQKQTGAQAAEGFILSEEFQNKAMTNAEYIGIMYRTFFGRSADEGGLAWWLSEMENGKSKSSVFAGFANSGEFGELCETYGIIQGSIAEPGEETEPTVSEFVKRLYSEIMGREADEGGLSYWVSELEGQKQTGAQAAEGFILSEEFQNKAMTNAEYIGIMYRTFFGRSADEGGLAWWLSEMENGKSKFSVFAGFANSDEFGKLCEMYGITQGEVTAE